MGKTSDTFSLTIFDMYVCIAVVAMAVAGKLLQKKKAQTRAYGLNRDDFNINQVKE